MRPRTVALFYFSSNVAIGVTTGVVLALALFKFLSSSLLTAMGEACGNIFRASQGFLATSRWSYLIAVSAAAFFLIQTALILGGGSRLLSITSRLKKARLRSSLSCPALPLISQQPWAPHTYLLSDATLDAHTIGILRPRILVNDGLVRELSADELKAVLAHEEAHRSGRDNLLLAVAKVFSLTLFYLPTAKAAFREMTRNLELAADEKAALSSGGPIQVASALAKIVSLSRQREAGPAIATAVSGTGPGDISARLQELIAEKPPHRRRWRLSLAFTAVSAAILLVFASSAFAVSENDEPGAFICFTEHTQESPAGGVCQLDHPDH